MPFSFRPSLRLPFGPVGRRILLWLMLFLGCLLVLAPATCWDALLRRSTQNNFSLLMAQGSLWNGNAQFAVLDPVSGRHRPLVPVSWKWNVSTLLRGHVSWDFSLAASPPFSLDVSASGVSLRAARLDMPAQWALARIPNALGRIGWHGDLQIIVPNWQCSWGKLCNGSLSADWLGAEADIFPGRRLGDYRLSVQAKNSVLDFNMATTSGEVPITAQGRWTIGGAYSLTGTLSGDPAFTSRLPNIAGQFVQRTSTPGSFTFSASGG